MVKNVKTYKQWKKLSHDEKVDIENEIWAPDYIKGQEIRKEILDEFRSRYANKEAIEKVEFRLYKYLLGIFVTIKKGYKARLPKKFDIFFVEKEYI